VNLGAGAQLCPLLIEAMDPLPLQMIKKYASILKVQCLALQYIDEIVKTITVQLPAYTIKSSLELYLPGIQSDIDRAWLFIKHLEKIIAACPALVPVPWAAAGLGLWSKWTQWQTSQVGQRR
jgi:hypothetical protein